MNNYVSTEKSLKRWLKNRVKVTMATVVGFLIAGTVAFGAEGIKVEYTETNTENIIQEAGEFQKNTTLLNYSKSEGTHIILNKGNLTAKQSNNAIYAQATNGANITIENEGALIVDTKNWSTAMNGKVGDATSTISLLNRGDITVTKGAGMDVTFAADGTGTITNEGNITVTAVQYDKENDKYDAVGMMIDGGKSLEKSKAVNKGTITVNGDGIGVELKGKTTFDNYGTIINQNYTEVDGESYYFAIHGDGESQVVNFHEGTKVVGDIDLADTDNDNDIINMNKVNNVFGEVLGAEKINIENSTVTFSDGGMEKVITSEDKHLLDITDSNVTNKMDLTSKGESANTIEKSNLINNYGKTAGTYTLINDGTLISNNAASGIYTNAQAEKAVMNVVNNGEINIEASGWATGLNGKFDKEKENAEISITNNGNIVVVNGAGMDITNAGAESNKGTLINSENGTITTSGFSVGMLADGKGMSAVNNGTIIINDADKHSDGRLSYGMQGKEGAVVTNNGTIILEYADIENVKAMGTADTKENVESSGINNGKIKLSDVASLEDIAVPLAEGISTEEYLAGQLFKGNVTHKGMIVNKLGVNIFADADLRKENDITGSEITAGEIGKDGVVDKVTVGTAGATLKGDDQSLQAETFNISGEVKIVADDNNKVVTIEDTTTNLDINGKFTVADETELAFVGGTVNGEKETDTVVLGNNSTLSFDGTTFNGNVAGTGKVEAVNAQITGTLDVSTLNIAGGEAEKMNVTYIDGEIGAGTINVGEATIKFRDNIELDKEVTNKLVLSSDSKFVKEGTLQINKGGQVIVEVGAGVNEKGQYNENVFANSTEKITIKGDHDSSTKDVILNIDNISGKEAVITLGDKVQGDGNAVADFDIDSLIYEMTEISNGNITVTFKDDLFKTNSTLNDINNASSVLNGKIFDSKDLKTREVQLDKIYSSNIYSETVRAAYDNVKLNEEAVESLARKSEVGKWTAEGKTLYSKNEYDRKGIVGDYSSEIESTGLMAAFGYGINETTTAGIALSGVKQDVDTDGGSADADLFYLGVYGNKVVGNYDFTAGLGYQFGEYDADNTIANVHGSDKYDTQALSGYVQGRYTADLGDGLSIQPKVKLGYTYVDQDNAKDSYFGVSDAEISTFDAEAGFDVVKSVQLEKTKVDVKFGASYIKAMGDTDKEFEGRFYGKGTSDKFDVLGADLAENTVKFNLGAEAVNENGFFYNGGFTYEFGSDDTEAYGVQAGVGYKF